MAEVVRAVEVEPDGVDQDQDPQDRERPEQPVLDRDCGG
jgi:hypothetical protein